MPFFFAILILVLLDQVSKYLAVVHIKPLPTYPLIRDVFHLTYAENRGAAFSIFQGKQAFLIGVTLIFTLFLIYYLIRTPKKRSTLWFTISLTLIIGGALGNLADRIRLNYVIDFFDFRYINFAIFNMADSFVVVGTLLLAGLLLFGDTSDIL